MWNLLFIRKILKYSALIMPVFAFRFFQFAINVQILRIRTVVELKGLTCQILKALRT